MEIQTANRSTHSCSTGLMVEEQRQPIWLRTDWEQLDKKIIIKVAKNLPVQMNTLQNTSQQESKLSEEFFQNIFLQAGDGIFLINERGILIEMNPRGCEILGYSREELQGQHVLKFQPVDEIDHMAKKLA